jgi:hypothetical protein
MNKRKIEATTSQLDRLLTDVSAAQQVQPLGEHITDDEAIGYAMKALSAEAVQRVDQHLAACPDCVVAVEQLVTATHFWNSAPGEARLDSLRERIRSGVLKKQPQRAASQKVGLINSAIANWFRSFNLAIAGATTTTLLVKAKTDDGSLRWNIEEDEDHNLTIRFGSHALELEGMLLRLSAGDWHAERRLAKRDPRDNQVGAKFFISRAEREQMPAETVLQVELINNATDAG